MWLDLEMTGLDPRVDKILEVAVIATDWDLNEIAEFRSGFGYTGDKIGSLLDANPFYTKLKENKKALLQLTADSPAVKTVERQLVTFVQDYFDLRQPVLLAGNSIHIDRQFIKNQLPILDQQLHYRMLDVSAWKVLFEGKLGKKYPKKELHRADDDVRESIAELKYYLEYVRNDS